MIVYTVRVSCCPWALTLVACVSSVHRWMVGVALCLQYLGWVLLLLMILSGIIIWDYGSWTCSIIPVNKLEGHPVCGGGDCFSRAFCRSCLVGWPPGSSTADPARKVSAQSSWRLALSWASELCPALFVPKPWRSSVSSTWYKLKVID